LIKSLNIALVLLIILSCSDQIRFNEEKILHQKVEAFKFLSDNHHYLHIMIDEEEGDKIKAFSELKNSPQLTTNFELIPVKNAIYRIENVNNDQKNIKRLDDLVDYYQSGLSIQIEAILRGYGHKEITNIESVLEIYDSLSR